jgi:hypothetical protein
MKRILLILLLGMSGVAFAVENAITIKIYEPMTKEQVMGRLTDLGACQTTMKHFNNFDAYRMDGFAEYFVLNWFAEKDQASVRKSYNDFKKRMTARIKSGVVPEDEARKYEEYCNRIVSMNPGK